MARPKYAALAPILKRIAVVAFCAALVVYVFSKALLMIGIYTAVVAWLIQRLIERKPLIPNTELNRCLAVIAATLVLSVALSGEWRAGLNGLHKWIRGFLIFWMSFELLQNEKTERQMSAAIAAAYLIATLDGLYQYANGLDFLRGYPVGYVNGQVVRITSSFGYFGMFASFLIMVSPIVIRFALLKKHDDMRTIPLLGLVVLGAICLYLTRTRAAWIVAVLLILLALMMFRKWKTIAILAALLCAAPFVLPHRIMFHQLKPGGVDKTIDHRFVLWWQAIYVTRAKPVFGCGLNTYPKNVEKYGTDIDEEAKIYYAHNGYLQHAAETGIAGLLAFVALLWRYYDLMVLDLKSKRHHRDRQMLAALALGVTGFVFYMVFDTIFHNLQPFLLFWVLLGWSLAVRERMHGHKQAT